MSVNSTSDYLLDNDCYTVSYNMFNANSALRVILLVPLSTFILYLGYQQWKQQCSFKTVSHSDVFTYHMATVELIWVLGYFVVCGGTYANHFVMLIVGSLAMFIASYGEMSFHLLTCVDRYLAVVHPITYLGLRNTRGTRMRNISIGCGWLLTFGMTGVTFLCIPPYTIVPRLCFLIFSIIIITFCSLSALCVLIHPGPGEKGGGKEKVDQLKQRAFCTITAITCAVWFLFFGLLVSTAVTVSPLLSSTVQCVVQNSSLWSNLPSCLVLPLLYLHKAGKLSCCCSKKKIIKG